jgi:hypothetical protein
VLIYVRGFSSAQTTKLLEELKENEKPTVGMKLNNTKHCTEGSNTSKQFQTLPIPIVKQLEANTSAPLAVAGVDSEAWRSLVCMRCLLEELAAQRVTC